MKRKSFINFVVLDRGSWKMKLINESTSYLDYILDICIF